MIERPELMMMKIKLGSYICLGIGYSLGLRNFLGFLWAGKQIIKNFTFCGLGWAFKDSLLLLASRARDKKVK